jgi:hypothetical protein
MEKTVKKLSGERTGMVIFYDNGNVWIDPKDTEVCKS